MLGLLDLIIRITSVFRLNFDPHSGAVLSTTRKIIHFDLKIFQLHLLVIFFFVHVLSISKVLLRFFRRIDCIFSAVYILDSSVKCLFRVVDLRFIIITLLQLCITGDDLVTAVYRRVDVLICCLVIRLIHRHETQLNIIF